MNNNFTHSFKSSFYKKNETFYQFFTFNTLSSFLLKKSIDNFKGANYLYKSKKYLPIIIHSAYYSCFQTITHILYSRFKLNYKILLQEMKDSGKSTHNLSIKKIYSDLFRNDEALATDFYQFINELKDMRNDSDYRDVEITIDDCGKALLLSNQINKILSDKYDSKRIY
jgi:hypothetical protein